MYYDEEFYREPSEFEQQIYEFKGSITNAIKDEFVAKMEQLKKENEELQDVKKRMNDIEREHKNKIYELEQAKRDAVNIVRHEKLTKLMETLYVKVYKPYSYKEKLPKCGECNEQRLIEFTSPSGKKMTEDCSCKHGEAKYRPEEHVCVEFMSDGGKIRAWYKPSDYKDSDRMVSANYMEKLHDDIRFEDIKYSWDVFFLDKDKCQAYCDWLMEQERKEAEVS